MTDFVKALRKAQQRGTTVLMASFDNAQELPAAPLTVLNVYECGTRFDIEHTNGERRTYRTQYALWLEDEDGRVPNLQAQKKLKQYQERRKQWARHQEQLRDLSTPLDRGAELTELSGTHNGVAKTFFAYRDKFSGRSIVFLSNPLYAKRVVTLIGEGGSVWTAIDVLLNAEFLWPIWIRQHEEANLGKEPDDFEKAFKWAARMPAQSVQLFFARGWKRHKVFRPGADHIEAKEVNRLRQVGLVVQAPRAPIDALIEYMPANELKAPLKARGIKPGLKEAVQKYYREHMDTDYEQQLRASSWLVGRECFVPPAGFTWEAWHEFRTAYADMFDALTNWAAGNLEPEKYAALV